MTAQHPLRGAERDAADDERHGDEREEHALAIAGTRVDAAEGDRRQGHRAAGHRRPRFEPQADLADLELVAVADRRGPLDRGPVDVRAIGAREVLHVPGPATEREDAMGGRRELVLDHDRVVHVASERVHRIEREDRAGRWLTRG